MTKINCIRKFGDHEQPNSQTQPDKTKTGPPGREGRGWDVMESQATELTYHPHLLPAKVLAV
jgi:hypothetical protein